jgi:HK97 family phage major capsid protein
MNVAALERDLRTKADEGLRLLKTTTAACEAENREMTAEERGAIDGISAECKTFEAKIARAKGNEALAASFEGLSRTLEAAAAAPVTGIARPTSRLTLGQQFVRAEAYDFFRKGLHRTQSAWRSPSIELATTITEDPASGGALVIPQYQPGIVPLLFRRLVVADLIAPGTTNSNAIITMNEKTFTNAAAPVAEGNLKPESALIFTAVTEAVRKIAHWLPVSEEMLEDAPTISSYIDARLRLGIELVEEDQLLNGDGVAPDLLGLTKRPGLAPPLARVDPASNADAILTQIMTIFATSYVMPDGVILNPADWASTLLTKTTTGEYFTSGPFSPIQAQTMWGLPVVVTPEMTAGIAFVGAFRSCAQVFRNGGLRVEASNSHADYFVRNLVAIRAEERLALCVYRPQAFGEVTGLAATTFAAAANGGGEHANRPKTGR